MHGCCCILGRDVLELPHCMTAGALGLDGESDVDLSANGGDSDAQLVDTLYQLCLDRWPLWRPPVGARCLGTCT